MADLSIVSEVRSEYFASLDYDLTADTAKAIRFISACRAILANANSASRDGTRYDFDLLRIENQLNQAVAWLSANQTFTDANALRNPSVTHADFSAFGQYSSRVS